MDHGHATSEDAAQADIGLVAALPIEIGAFMERCAKTRSYSGGKFTFRGGKYDDIRIAAVESGMTFVRARTATQALLDAHQPRWVISVGFSGSIQPEIKIGDIVVATSIADTHGNELMLDLQMPANPAQGLHVGRILTVDQIVRTVEEKKSLAEKYQGLAVDLESLAVAQVCKAAKVRFLAVRVITDDLSADLPAEVLSVVGSTGYLRVGAALGALWKRPSSISDMLILRDTANKAAGRLADFLDGVVKQLHAAK